MKSRLYQDRKERLERHGFKVDETGAFAAAVWPKKLPADYPRDVFFPEACAYVFYDNGGVFFPFRFQEPVVASYQNPIKTLCGLSSLTTADVSYMFFAIYGESSPHPHDYETRYPEDFF